MATQRDINIAQLFETDESLVRASLGVPINDDDGGGVHYKLAFVLDYLDIVSAIKERHFQNADQYQMQRVDELIQDVKRATWKPNDDDEEHFMYDPVTQENLDEHISKFEEFERKFVNSMVYAEYVQNAHGSEWKKEMIKSLTKLADKFDFILELVYESERSSAQRFIGHISNSWTDLSSKDLPKAYQTVVYDVMRDLTKSLVMIENENMPRLQDGEGMVKLFKMLWDLIKAQELEELKDVEFFEENNWGGFAHDMLNTLKTSHRDKKYTEIPPNVQNVMNALADFVNLWDTLMKLTIKISIYRVQPHNLKRWLHAHYKKIHTKFTAVKAFHVVNKFQTLLNNMKKLKGSRDQSQCTLSVCMRCGLLTES